MNIFHSCVISGNNSAYSFPLVAISPIVVYLLASWSLTIYLCRGIFDKYSKGPLGRSLELFLCEVPSSSLICSISFRYLGLLRLRCLLPRLSETSALTEIFGPLLSALWLWKCLHNGDCGHCSLTLLVSFLSGITVLHCLII